MIPFIFQFASIRTRLNFWFLLSAITPLLIVSVLISYKRTQAIKAEAFNKLIAIRDLKVDQVNEWLDDKINDISSIADDYEIKVLEVFYGRTVWDANLKEKQLAVNLLRRHKKTFSEYNELFVINPINGKIELSTENSTIGSDKSRYAYFIRPLTQKELFIQNIYYSKTVHLPVMAFSVPIYGNERNTEIIGVLVVRMNLKESIHDLMSNRTGMGTTGETLIVNEKGTALNDLRWQPDAPLNFTINAEPARLAAQGKTGVIEAKDYRDVPVVAAYTYIPKLQWGFVAKMDLDEIYAPIPAMYRHIALIFIISAMVVYLLSLFLANKISHPIIQMAQTADKIQHGDVQARISNGGDDELGFLASAFNTMTDAIHSRLIIEKGVTRIVEAMVEYSDPDQFRRHVLDVIMDVTGSSCTAYHIYNADTGFFEHAASVGISAERLKPFNTKMLEGDLGRALSSQKISLIKNIPADTIFCFKTFTGTILPKEIVTIPIFQGESVTDVISLSNIKSYSHENLEILNLIQLPLSTAIANVTSHLAAKKMAAELEQKNSELSMQASEMAAQAAELRAQSQQLTQQNVELEKQRDTVEKANQLKSEFLSNMSHELRTPLNSIMALSRVLILQASKTMSAEHSGYLEIIERNGKNLLALINDILDLSKIEAGHMDVKPKVFSLTSMIEVIIERLEPLTEEKAIDIKFDASEAVSEIESDEMRVHQIIQNLIGNAVKFTDQGYVHVVVTSVGQDVVIQISDTGIGIAPDDLPTIFQAFRQVDGSASRRFEGTGLGLAIAQRTAALLGGKITVRSTLGKGSIFELILPKMFQKGASDGMILLDSLERVSSRHLDETTDTRDGQPERIAGCPADVRLLLIEDNESAIIQIKNALEHSGYIVDVARGGQAGVDYLQHTIPAGIILDLMMPGVNGFEVLEKIRKSGETAGVPVLILTAKDLTRQDLNRLSTKRIQHLVQKGDVAFNELVAKIGKMIEAKPQKPVLGHASEAQNEMAVIKRKADMKENQVNVSGRQDLGSIKPTLFVVEDNPDNMTAIKAILQESYDVIEADRGPTGFQAIVDVKPDLVLLDISLPRVDGYAVVSEIKARPETSHIPVIALSAHAMPGDREKILAAGCDDYESKPVDPKALIAKVGYWINRRNVSSQFESEA